jgi:hypothetical protein
MKNNVRQFLIPISALLCFSSAHPQSWSWVQDDRVINPSGLVISTAVAQFQVLDWNGDALPDFFINEDGRLRFYRHEAGAPDRWQVQALALPQIGLNTIYGYLSYPKNFRFIDWDRDGDFDLAADSSFFWWNNGSNAIPEWQRNDTILAGIPDGNDFFFSDYDDDGDWDAIAHLQPGFYPRFYRNDSTSLYPVWTPVESLLGGDSGAFGRNAIEQTAAARFFDLNGDGLQDVLGVWPGLGDPGFSLWLHAVVNSGTLDEPAWETRDYVIPPYWFSGDGFAIPAYDFYDFNRDGLLDFVQTNWRRGLALKLNRGTADSSAFSEQPDQIWGAINVRAHARPFFYDANRDGQPDLVVSYLAASQLIQYYFNDGAFTGFENNNGVFAPKAELNEGFPQPYKYYPFITANQFTLSLADVDDDGDDDYLLGLHRIGNFNKFLGTAIRFFQNIGSQTKPDWQPDTSRFRYFFQPDSNFYAPILIDIDHDSDLDLFIERQGKFTFYERLNTTEERWQENKNWRNGLDTLGHYSAVFADLNRDGLDDLVYGEHDGTLSLFENSGTTTSPRWRRNPTAFQGIDVQASAAPAFADLNNDGRLDLVAGNAAGLLFYYRNDSTVPVRLAHSGQPDAFHLHQNYPNPFNTATVIRYDLPEVAHVKLAVYDLAGRRVALLVDGFRDAGVHRVLFDASGLASGIYFYRTEARKDLHGKEVGFRQTRKLAVVK